MIDESHAVPKDEAASGSPIDDRVLFFERAGVHEDVAESIFADASHQVQFSDTDAELTRVRLVPSSRVEVDGGVRFSRTRPSRSASDPSSSAPS